MPPDLDAHWRTEFLRVLGDEVRKLRHHHGWTRDYWRQTCFPELSTQTLATYELGTRPMSVVRFALARESLGELPPEVMHRAYERIERDTERTAWNVDLVAASRLTDAELAPLRAWANLQLQAGPDKVKPLSRNAVHPLAALCGLDTDELLRRLPRPYPTN